MLDESLDEEEEESKFSCEHCKKEFPSKTFLIHISRKSDCKAFYGPRFEEMKKKKKHENVKRFRKKTDNQTLYLNPKLNHCRTSINAVCILKLICGLVFF